LPCAPRTAALVGPRLVYSPRLSFAVDVDHRAGEDFRVIQLTPCGSACSIALMRKRTPDAYGRRCQSWRRATSRHPSVPLAAGLNVHEAAATG
jgi:hypothetical protein